MNIDIAKVNKGSWILRAIDEFQIFLDDHELLHFLQMSHDQTATFLCIHNSLRAEHPSHYLFGLTRKLSFYIPTVQLPI